MCKSGEVNMCSDR